MSTEPKEPDNLSYDDVMAALAQASGYDSDKPAQRRDQSYEFRERPTSAKVAQTSLPSAGTISI